MLFTVIDDPSSHEVISFKIGVEMRIPLMSVKETLYLLFEKLASGVWGDWFKYCKGLGDLQLRCMYRTIEHNSTVFEDQSDSRACDHRFFILFFAKFWRVDEFQHQNQIRVELSSTGTFDVYSQHKILHKSLYEAVSDYKYYYDYGIFSYCRGRFFHLSCTFFLLFGILFITPFCYVLYVNLVI